MMRNLLPERKRYIVFLIFIASAFIFSQFANAQPVSQTFSSNGSFTVPAGVTSITVECWGAGGAGGGSTLNNNGGSGGGGGAYATSTVTVTVGQVIPVTVGTGGSGSAGNDGGNGNPSSVLGLTANGGTGGATNKGTAGSGGTATGGSTNTSGGNGNVGTTIGGNGGNGGNGGAGGNGAQNGNGGAGVIPGGGGGGGERGGGSNRAGGNGANGQVIISYVLPVITINPANLGFGYVASGSSSINQSYVLSGTGLNPASGNITVTAPANFQVSLSSGSGFGSSVTVPYSGSTLGNTTIYARFLPTSPNTDYSGNIANSGGGATTQNVAVTGTSIRPNYCIPNTNTNSLRYISNVNLNSINNSSGFPGSYSDYTTTVSTNATIGIQYALKVTISFPTNPTGSAFVYVWFDWNQDGDFEDSGEYYYIDNAGGSGNTNDVTVTGNIAIPSGAILGNTRMRVAATNTNPIVGGSCLTNANYGEAEDYTVNIQTPVTITTGTISPTTYCAGSSVSVPFTISGTFNAGNIFTAQLSDASGSFTSPVTIGTLTSQTAGTINATIPLGQAAGSGYKIRVISSNPVATGSDSGSTITVSSPSITLASSGSRCGPGAVTLSATGSGSINWYTSSTGGSSLFTGGTFTTPSLSSSTTYYVDATSGTCISSPRVAVIASIVPAATITAGGGGSYCTGNNVALTSTGTNITNQYWTGPASYYSLSQNPTITGVTAANAGTYTVTGSSLSGINLVSNGNFEAGNTGFTTQYTLAAPTSSGLNPEGTYDVVSLPSSRHANFCSCGDHTSGSGLQMVINGAGTESIIWGQTVNVTPNTAYQFTYWVQTVVNGNDANPSKIQLFVNGTNAGPVYTANATTGAWTQFTYNWTSGSGVTTAVLNLKNENFAAGGNDFALDDIVFQQACSATATVNVSVANSYTPSVSIAASSSSICSGTSVTFTATPTNGGVTPSYQWKVGAANVGTNSSTYTTSSLANGNVVTCVLTSSLSCASPATATSNSVSMSVSPQPAWSGYSLPSPTSLCLGGTVSFNVSVTGGLGGAITWIRSSTPGGVGTTVTTGDAPGIGTWYYRPHYAPTGSGCTLSDGTETAVVVNDLPAAVTVSGGGTFCGNTTITATGGTGGTIYFQGTTNGGTSIATASASQVVTTSGTYYFRSRSASGCWGTQGSVTVTINPIPAAPTAGNNGPLCAGSTLNLTASNIAGATYSWTGPNGFSSALQNPSLNNITNAASGTYFVTATVNGCTSSTGNTTVIVDATTSGGTLSGGTSPICLGSSMGTLSLSGYVGSIVRWESQFNSGAWNNLNNAGNATFSETQYSPGTYKYRAVVKNGACGEATSNEITIVVDALTVGGGIFTGNTPICMGSSTGTMSLTGYTGSVIQWEKRVDSGLWTVVSNTSDSYSESPTSAGTWEYRALVKSGACASAYSTSFSVVVTPTLSISLGSNPAVCQQTTVASLSYTATTGNPTNWILTFDAAAKAAGMSDQNNSLGAAPGNITVNIPSAIAAGTYNALLTVITYSPACSSVSYPVTITVNSLPAASISSNNSPVCSGGNAIFNLSGTSGSTVTYNLNGGSNSTVVLTGGTATITVFGATSNQTLNLVTAELGGCSQNLYGSATVTVNTLPTMTTGSATDICVGATSFKIPYTATSGSPNQYSISGTGITTVTNAALGASPITVNLTGPANLGTISYTLTVRNSGIGCSSDNVNGSLSVVSIPSAPTTTNAEICIGSSATVSASGATSGNFYRWYDAASGGNLLKTSTNNADNTFTTPVLGATTSYWVSIINSGGCESTRTQVTATYPAVSTDDQTVSGTDSWIGHMYDGTGFDTYFGHNTEPENFTEGFGGNTTCYTITSQSSTRSIYTETFSMRYRMTTSKSGCWLVTLRSDDGVRLSIDGVKIFDQWNDHAPADYNNVLAPLSNGSKLVLEYYENTGQNEIGFSNLTPIGNTLTSNTAQTKCIGDAFSAISGTVTPLPAGITTSGWQWYYSTSPTGSGTAIASATSADYTPAGAPFTTAGTYYVYRTVNINSSNAVGGNNVGATSPVSCTIESDRATVIVNSLPAAVAGADRSICLGANTQLGAANVSGSSYNWSSVPAGFTSNSANPTVNPTVTTTYTVVETNSGGCVNSNSVVVTVNPIPVGSASSQTICNGSASSVVLSSTVAGSTFTWTAAQLSGSTITGFSDCNSSCGTTIAQTLNNSSSAEGVVRYTVTPKSPGGCDGSSFTVDVTVLPSPTITYSLTSASACLNGTSPVVTFTNPLSLAVTVTFSVTVNAAAPFDYAVNVGANGSATISVPTNVLGTYYGDNIRVAYQDAPDCSRTLALSPISININEQPSAPTLLTKTPDLNAVCEGANLNAIFTAGNGGLGCTDSYQYSIDNGNSWLAYTPGSSISTLGASVVLVQGKRDGCDAGTGCLGTSFVTLASWTVNPQPIGPTLNVKIPNLTNFCLGAGVSATFNAGSGGTGCSDDYIVIIDGGAPVSYVPGSLVGNSALTSIEIQGRRASCTSGSGCTGTSYVSLAKWLVDDINPTITCPDDITVNAESGICSALVALPVPVVSDNCTSAPTITWTASSGVLRVDDTHARVAVGTSTIFYRVTDEAGKYVECSFNITVDDKIVPTIVCPADITVSGFSNIPAKLNQSDFGVFAGTSIADNCGIQSNSLTVSDVYSNTCLPGQPFTINRTYTIYDIHGNSAFCTQTITVQDVSIDITADYLTACPKQTIHMSVLSLTGFGATPIYQWQKSTNSGGTWTDISGATTNTLSVTAASIGDQYRLHVSTGLSNQDCYSNVLITHPDNTAPQFPFDTNKYTSIVLCRTTVPATIDDLITATDVIDDCAEFADIKADYTITNSGSTIASQTNVPVSNINSFAFPEGVSHVSITVYDGASPANSTTYSFDVTMGALPSVTSIAFSAGGDQPAQCSSYSYSLDGGTPESGFSYTWEVFSGSTLVTSGYSLTTINAAAVDILWTGDLAAGNYTLVVTKKAGNNCEIKATLPVAVQNSFDLKVNPAGHDCKGEVTESTPFRISWSVDEVCGTSTWGFTYYIFAQDLNTLPADYLTVNDGTGSFSGITGSSKLFDTDVINGNPYLQTVYTLFIVNTNDSNPTNNFNKFYLKGIPETSEITTD